jgi:hypothetical protein
VGCSSKFSSRREALVLIPNDKISVLGIKLSLRFANPPNGRVDLFRTFGGSAPLSVAFPCRSALLLGDVWPQCYLNSFSLCRSCVREAPPPGHLLLVHAAAGPFDSPARIAKLAKARALWHSPGVLHRRPSAFLRLHWCSDIQAIRHPSSRSLSITRKGNRVMNFIFTREDDKLSILGFKIPGFRDDATLLSVDCV